MNRLRVVLLLMLCLMLFATCADAECAWVLWSRTEDDRYQTRTDWLNHAAYPSYTRCWGRIMGYTGIPVEGSLLDWWYWMRGAGRYDRRMQTKDIAHMKENDVYMGGRDNGVLIVTQHTTTEFQCLPDTVDPRGPKGGAR